MGEKRYYDDNRVQVKLQVHFGPQGLDNMGFTEDISASGIFIKTAVVYPPESELMIEIVTEERESIRLVGFVHWAKKVAPNLVWSVNDAGMGVQIIRFDEGKDAYYRLLATAT